MFKFICPHCRIGFKENPLPKEPKKKNPKCPKCDKIIDIQDYCRGFDLAAE